MKQRDQKEPKYKPLKRLLHFRGETWSYQVGKSAVHLRTSDHRITYAVPLPDITGESWDQIERAEWKHYWEGVRPQKIKSYIRDHLLPNPEFRLPTVMYMHPNGGDRWHRYEHCRFLPHLKTGQVFDPVKIEVEQWEGVLKEPPTRLNLCGVCMKRWRLRCMDCKNPKPQQYMVNKPLWNEAVPDRKGFLCFSCLSARISRPLRQSDFSTDIPINRFRPVSDEIAKLST